MALIAQGKYDIIVEGKEKRIHDEREIIRELLLHDKEIQDLLKKIVAEMSADKRD